LFLEIFILDFCETRVKLDVDIKKNLIALHANLEASYSSLIAIVNNLKTMFVNLFQKLNTN